MMRDPQINAFALPGGHIGLHTGLIVAAQSESEMAGVLGHEIAHIANGDMVAIDDLGLIPGLNRRLVEAGLAVRRLEPVQASLEQRFLAITSRLDEAA